MVMSLVTLACTALILAYAALAVGLAATAVWAMLWVGSQSLVWLGILVAALFAGWLARCLGRVERLHDSMFRAAFRWGWAADEMARAGRHQQLAAQEMTKLLAPNREDH